MCDSGYEDLTPSNLDDACTEIPCASGCEIC